MRTLRGKFRTNEYYRQFGQEKEIPVHLAWDEKISFHNGKEVYIGLNSSQDCILGHTADAGRIVFDRRYFWFKGGIRSI